MTNTKDLVVIGAGMAGIAAANKCAASGWRVAIVDELPYGGTCALRGCDPKKMLRRGAEIIDAANLMHGRGIKAGGLAIDWAGLMAHKRCFTNNVPAKMEAGLEKNGVVSFHKRPLIPVAVFKGMVPATNMMRGTSCVPDYTGVTSSAFTTREL